MSIKASIQRGILRAAAVTVTSGFQETEGASTITQQLIKNNVFTDWTDENFFQSVRRKIQEQQLAVELEEYLTEQGLDAKSVILEEYLNTVNFGSGAYGIQDRGPDLFWKGQPGSDSFRVRGTGGDPPESYKMGSQAES